MKDLFFCEFNFTGAGAKYEAFKAMGTVFNSNMDQGLVFRKAMGTGSGSGFSIVPDFGRYAFLLGFDTKVSIERVMETLPYSEDFARTNTGSLVVRLEVAKSHGKWGGVDPFNSGRSNLDESEPLAVLTRARIRTRKLFDFWRNVPATAKYMKNGPGVIYQSGIGEYPIFMQATFSFWESKKRLLAAAYGNNKHAEMVRKTRERNWYSEELFAQFKIVEFQSTGSRYAPLSEKLIQAGIPNSLS